MKIILQYPQGALRGDCLRALAGLLLVLALLGLGPPGVYPGLILAALAGLFLVYLLCVWRRFHRSYVLDESGLERRPDGRSIAWTELSDLRLAYYTTRRDQADGWLELKLVAGQRVIRVDSRLDSFQLLLQRALNAARDRQLPLAPATFSNAGRFGAPAAGKATTSGILHG